MARQDQDNYRLNNEERERWIDNDESLYTWWKSERMSKRNFIKENKEEIDKKILAVLNRKPSR
jgi:hypothetical protein